MTDDSTGENPDVPKEINRHFGDEASESIKPSDYTAEQREEDIKEAREYSDND